MANEYGYEPSGSVVGGLGQLLQMNREHDEDEQKKAAVPFLNHVLSQYLGGNTLPNFQALAPFVQSREGLSRAGVNDASAGNLESETSQRNALTPGMVEHQGLENTGLGQENTIRAGSLQDLIAAPGIRNEEGQANIQRSQAETSNALAQQPWIGPEAQARIGGQNAMTNEANTRSSLMEPEFDLSKSKLAYEMSDPNNEAALNAARAKNFNAETALYGQAGSPQGSQPAVQGSGMDPAVRQKVLDALTGGGQAQQQPQQSFGDLMGSLTGNRQNVEGVNLDAHGSVIPSQEQQAQSQVNDGKRNTDILRQQLDKVKMMIQQPNQSQQDLVHLQAMYDAITKKLGNQ